MRILIKDLNINYTQVGEGKDLVFLHGWRRNIASMEPLAKPFSKDYRITILDLPGFGESDEPKTSWNIYDYTSFFSEFLTKLNIKKPIIIAHSFGGRIAQVYASTKPVEKLVLLGAPCIRPLVKKSFKYKVFGIIKKIPGTKPLVNYLKKHMGSVDYRSANPIMRDTLVKTVNEDLSECAKKITAPTLLIWGTLDTAAPIEYARKLEKLIKDCALIELPNCTHDAYLEALPQVVLILKAFFNEVAK